MRKLAYLTLRSTLAVSTRRNPIMLRNGQLWRSARRRVPVGIQIAESEKTWSSTISFGARSGAASCLPMVRAPASQRSSDDLGGPCPGQIISRKQPANCYFVSFLDVRVSFFRCSPQPVEVLCTVPADVTMDQLLTRGLELKPPSFFHFLSRRKRPPFLLVAFFPGYLQLTQQNRFIPLTHA